MLGNWEIQEPTPKAARTLCSAAWRPWPTRTIRVDGPRTIRVDGPCMRAGHEVEGKVRRPTQIHDPNACLPTSCQWQEAEEATRTVSLRSRNAWRGPKTRSPAERLGKADADQRQVWRARMPVAPRAAAIVLSPLPTCATQQSDCAQASLDGSASGSGAGAGFRSGWYPALSVKQASPCYWINPYCTVQPL